MSNILNFKILIAFMRACLNKFDMFIFLKINIQVYKKKNRKR